MNPSFWRGKRVLVTGHTGFKGSWLVLWLASMGAEVSGYADGVPTDPALFDLARVADGMTASVTGDVRDFAQVEKTVAELRPEVVFHMAAQPLVRRSFDDPLETYATNVMGTAHVFEAVRRAGGARVVVNVTTDKCYENREWEWGYREDEPKGGFDPYSNSKACSELVTDAYRRSFFEPTAADGGTVLASARAGNVIGGGDWAVDRLVPDLMRAAMERRVVVLRNPDAIRPWQHVLNPLGGYLLLAEAAWDEPAHATGWNFGPEDRDAQPVRWIVDRIGDLWDGGLRWELDAGPQPHEAHYLKLDSSRARMRLGWRPAWDVGEGLRRTVEWYRAFAAGDDVRELTLEQIRVYADESAAAPSPR